MRRAEAGIARLRAGATGGGDRRGAYRRRPQRPLSDAPASRADARLDKAYTEAEWRAFHAQLAKPRGRPDLGFVVEPKYGGMAISLTHAHGVLVRAVTRGNGAEGDDVTAQCARDHRPARKNEGSRDSRLGGVAWGDLLRLGRIHAAQEAAGEGAGAKLAEAQRMGVRILTAQEFETLLGPP
ncbi:MAG: hypothetical protein ACOZE5_15815 [Verrucomicrobiota bacterium]